MGFNGVPVITLVAPQLEVGVNDWIALASFDLDAYAREREFQKH
jgi:hypothetical protein